MCVSGMQRAYCGHILSVQFTLSSSAVAPFVYLQTTLAGNFKYTFAYLYSFLANALVIRAH